MLYSLLCVHSEIACLSDGVLQSGLLLLLVLLLLSCWLAVGKKTKTETDSTKVARRSQSALQHSSSVIKCEVNIADRRRRRHHQPVGTVSASQWRHNNQGNQFCYAFRAGVEMRDPPSRHGRRWN